MKLPKIISLILPLTLAIASGCMMLSGMMINKTKGTAFTIKLDANPKDKNGIVEKAVKVIENRLYRAGIHGEAVADKENAEQIVVKIYGSNDLEKTKKFLFTTNQMELKEVISPPTPIAVTTYSTRADAENVAREGSEILSYMDAKNAMELFVIVKNPAIVTGADIRDAQAVSETAGESYHISFSLNKEGALRFGEWTGKNITHYMAIVLDKKVLSMPFIKSQIFDSAQIDGKFTKEEAEDLALSLKSGYLPATMKIVKEEKFGN